MDPTGQNLGERESLKILLRMTIALAFAFGAQWCFADDTRILDVVFDEGSDMPSPARPAVSAKQVFVAATCSATVSAPMKRMSPVASLAA